MASRIQGAASAGEVTNTDAVNWTDGITFNYTPPASKDIVIGWSCLAKLPDTSNSCHVRLFETSQRVFQTWECKEASTPVDYRSHGGMYKFTSGASPSAMALKAQVKREAGTATAAGKEFSIVALELAANDVYAEALSRTTTTNGSGSPVTKLTANITPPSTGDYLIVFTAHVDATAALAVGVNALVDGASVIGGADVHVAKDTTDRMPWMRVFKKTGWTNAAHTASIQFFAQDAGTVGIEEARILIIRLDALSANYYAADFTGGASTSTTYQDRVTLTETTAAGDHLLISAGIFQATNSATVSSFGQITEDGVTLQESTNETPVGSISDEAVLITWRVRTLTAASHTLKYQSKSETTSVSTHGNGSIALLQFPAGDITMAADAGSFTITGTDAALKRSLLVSAEAGSYAITGSDANLVRRYTLTADAGAFAVVGSDATLARAYLFSADAGAVAITGTDADLAKVFALAAEEGAVTIAGTDAALLRSSVLAADAGAVDIAGTAAGLLRSLRVDAEPGSLLVTGMDAGLLRGYPMQADAGSFAIDGTAAELFRAVRIDAGAGNFVIDGMPVDLRRDAVIAADAGSVLIVGTDANLTYGVSYRLDAGIGSFVIAGSDADLLRSLRLPADGGAVLITGTAAALAYSRLLEAGPGAFVVSGQPAILAKSLLLAAEAGAWTIDGTPATLIRTYVLLADPGSVVIVGFDAGLVYDHVSAAPPRVIDLPATIVDHRLDLPATWSRNIAIAGVVKRVDAISATVPGETALPATMPGPIEG